MTGIAVSDRHPYMFSGSLDKEVKCWDLEYNKASAQISQFGTIVAKFHGHHSYPTPSSPRRCIPCQPCASPSMLVFFYTRFHATRRLSDSITVT